MASPEISGIAARSHATWAGHVAIMRFDHWFKNVFVLPGVVVALTMTNEWPPAIVGRLVLGLLSIGLIASSNYVLNEVLDGATDRHHRLKYTRPVPQGLVSIPLAYAQWIALMVCGLGLGWAVSPGFAATVLTLWIMGCVYNIPPLRTKDRPFVDVLSEAINNPLRLLSGWAIVGPNAIAPGSLLLSYWMIGGYFMALKRYAELRTIGPASAAKYRPSFAIYDENRLLTSTMFYAAAAMLFFGVFVMRYRLELILSFPAVALAMAIYMQISLLPDSPAQHPEGLYREGRLVAATVLCAAIMIACLLIDMPWLDRLVTPTAPIR